MAVVFYGRVLLALDVSLTLLVWYAAEQRRLVKGRDRRRRRRGGVAGRPSHAFYAVAIGIGFLLPTVGVALYLAIALLAVPMRTLHHLLRRR